ncbi:MAG: flagellar filament capping protein FliD [Bryobacteraceae bacterium]|nr:flagellar filament capping protein FliD [Bryobacteraceae bacterium]
MGTSGVSSLFSGNSRFAVDFQQIIDRSVAIASLPMQQMQAQQSQLAQERSALAALEGKFTALRSAVQQIESSLSNLAASVSNSAVASASASGTAMVGTYELEVVSIGSQTLSLSAGGLNTVTDPSSQNISSSSSFTLRVDGQDYEIRPAANTLSALAEALNSAGAGVEATVVNVGSGQTPDYRLSLRASKLGPVSVQLNDGSQDLLDTLASGTLASYRLQGQQGDPITTDSRTVTLAPGLSVTLLQAGTATITVRRNLTGLSAGLSALASAYNSALQELDQHRGQQKGALQGSAVVQTLSAALRSLAGYRAGEANRSLEELGLSFDQNGLLSLDQAALESRAGSDWAGVAEFLGATSSSGFLKSAADALNGLLDADSGVLPSTVKGISNEEARITERISAEQERIDQLKEHLQARMAAADALIASMEQQAKYFKSLFETMMSSWQTRY